MADENVRNFSDETIQKGKAQLSLQESAMTQGASQKGMAPYGMQRKM